MSYNGYTNPNSYSPYFQGTTGQDGREQYTDQSRHSAGYQNSSYQPLSAYQTTQQHPQSSAPRSASISAYGNQGYGNVNGPGSSRSQDGRANYTTGGRQTDTTALGNLAYASTLGRGNTPLQQNMNYTRTQDYGGSTSYGVNSTMPAQYGAGHQRTDSRGATATSREDYAGRSQATTSTPGTGYNPDESNSTYQRQQGSGGGNWQAQAQYIAAQRPSTEQNRLSQYSIQPPRPTSGQAIQYPSSRINAQSPTIPAAQAVLQRRDTSSVRSIDQNRIQSPQQQSNRTIGTPTGFQGGNTTAKPQQQQATGHSSAHHSPKTASLGQPADTSVRPHAAIDTRVNGRTSQLSTPTMSEYPTTVDPSRIFNHVEYQRRQAAAAAEQEAARNKATETAQAAKQPNPNPPNNPQPWKDMARNVVTQPTRTPSTPGSNAPPTTDGDTDPDTAKRTQMELEMKQMIEKMRDYKSKDPSLFSQIWEQVKKVCFPDFLFRPSLIMPPGSTSPASAFDISCPRLAISSCGQ